MIDMKQFDEYLQNNLNKSATELYNLGQKHESEIIRTEINKRFNYIPSTFYDIPECLALIQIVNNIIDKECRKHEAEV